MNGSGHILIVDDDREIRSLLSRYLAEQGMRVSVAADRKECEAMVATGKPDLVVLDVMLPDGSGLDICRMLRERQPSLAIILLTALKEDVDRIIGLEIGADDYLGKPFNPRELLARIKAILRRTGQTAESPPSARLYFFEGFEADPALRMVRHESGAQLDLTGAEFDLLQVFLERPGRLLSRDQLLDLTQGRNRDPMDRSIDVLISRLRRKLNEHTEAMIFKTVRNGGYQLTVTVRTLAGGR
ncbi:DNA-binding response regulator, OmpR family, contains REC and winged-helix (wHTH) domain [Rhizobium sp. RU35A]|uniref:Regulatory protein VirG n=1 Tax=Rhizobium straminoryzae TaxID=1387186 RepID=A0A549TBD8_9HYPH|nr:MULTISPECIES: response regulator transcription factor [Rhizobium]TRL39202.1 response regulator transcription factor [Rhizobium straminoryzae]SIQ38147.1 DNA-binding response regulator, OmpR family, contains REC and winged-helix (wHTH) domain [Rhizobium sp. RU35A]